MRTLKRIVTAAVLLGALSACTTTPASSNVDSLETPAAAPESAGVAEQVAQRFLEAANAGDEAGVAALFAEDARFDSVGRIYANRQEIMDRFLVPEVLRVGGRYESTGQQWQGGRLTVTYRFTTRSGGQERFTYAYLIRDGLIRDVIGRYI